LDKSKANDIIEYQLIKSGTSCGGNYEEAQAASSQADFKYKVGISLREMRESNYWLRILRAIGIQDNTNHELINESEELKKILGSICKKASNTS
jgi:four helix bundle protein